MARYVECVIKNVKWISKKESRKVKTVYFGGGTPTALGGTGISKILNEIKSNFTLDEYCEITVEANPKTISEETAIKLKKSGINRISMGLQTANDEQLKVLGRCHTVKDFETTLEILRKTGFQNISTDLIYALPSETVGDVIADVEYLISLKLNHISAYALSIEENTPFWKKKNLLSLPSDDDCADMYLKICELLQKNGYFHYEISNFALTSFESKHNNRYWERKEYIGIGASAHSFWKNNRFYSPPSRELYCSLTEKGEFEKAFGINIGEEVTDSEKRDEEIFLGLRTKKGIFIPYLSKNLKRYVDEGFATYKDGRFSLTDKGFFVCDTVTLAVMDLGDFNNERKQKCTLK